MNTYLVSVWKIDYRGERTITDNQVMSEIDLNAIIGGYVRMYGKARLSGEGNQITFSGTYLSAGGNYEIHTAVIDYDRQEVAP